MNVLSPPVPQRRFISWPWLCCIPFYVPRILFPGLALVRSGSPFDSGSTNLQTLFTRTVA